MSINEIKVGSVIRVKVGRNVILARVLEILNDGFRVCSVVKNKEFHVTPSRVEFDAGDSEQHVPARAEPQTEDGQEAVEKEPAEGQVEPGVEAEAPEAVEQESAETKPQKETEHNAEDESAAIEIVPEDEAAEFISSGEDEEDEYAINPAHESDKPQKRMSLLNAAVEVLKAAGPDHPLNCKEILEAILERQLWTPTDCKTPEQTLYGSIFREINTKANPRIVKSDVKGKFRIAE